MNSSPRTPEPAPDRMLEPKDLAPDAVWRKLCEGQSRSWLDEIGSLRAEADDLERSLDIWSIALIAALSDETRRETASIVVARLRKLSDQIEGQAP